MYDRMTRELTFPHIILGDTINGKKHTFNSINGGIKMISDSPFHLIRDLFFGGNVIHLGLITEYGFYACPYYDSEIKIVGFYIHDPQYLTELGKKIIEDLYPNTKIYYSAVSVSPERTFSASELEHKKELVEEIQKCEGAIPTVDGLNLEELEGLVKVVKSGRQKDSAGNPVKVSVERPVTSVDDVPVLIKKGR